MLEYIFNLIFGAREISYVDEETLKYRSNH